MTEVETAVHETLGSLSPLMKRIVFRAFSSRELAIQIKEGYPNIQAPLEDFVQATIRY